LMEALICDLGDFGFGLVVTRSWTNIGERKKGIFLIVVFWKRLNFKASIFVVILWETEEIEAQSSNLLCYFEFLIELESFNLFESFLFTLTLTLAVKTFSRFPSLSLSRPFFQSISLKVSYNNVSDRSLSLEMKQEGGVHLLAAKER
jgi:hypothetical protein